MKNAYTPDDIVSICMTRRCEGKLTFQWYKLSKRPGFELRSSEEIGPRHDIFYAFHFEPPASVPDQSMCNINRRYPVAGGMFQ